MTAVPISPDVTARVRFAAESAKAASRHLAQVSTAVKNVALEHIAMALHDGARAILDANLMDVSEARDTLSRGVLSQALFDRLVLDRVKLRSMITSIREVARLDDPVGRTLARTLLDDGLELEKVTTPLGVIAAIFEARPDAVTQIATLALKSGNAVVLKGGSEATRTTGALVDCMRNALNESATIPADAICAVDGRAAVDALLGLDDLIDLVVPRGSGALVRSVQSRTRIPVLGHAEGICHVYVDREADIAMAVAIVIDSKMQYPAACNATETVLIHRDLAPAVLIPLLERLGACGVEVRACGDSLALAQSLGIPDSLVSATSNDWRTEYGGPVLACKLVDSVEAAIEHVNRYGSGHTDTIVTGNPETAAKFLVSVDSAGVFHNASTRFADGFRYGLGAEVGVSTGKLHARGPVGLEGLTTYKYLLRGNGHVVATYSGTDARPFVHERLEVSRTQ